MNAFLTRIVWRYQSGNQNL